VKADERQPILDRHPEAVTYIEALEAELEALRTRHRQAVEALDSIAGMFGTPDMDLAPHMRKMARAALEGSAP